jgi:hypothetical protein
MNEEIDHRDSLIDGALASYTPAARPGLEQRILASLTAESNRVPRLWRWRPLWQFVALALLVAVASTPFWFRHNRSGVAMVQRPAIEMAGSSTLNQPALASPAQLVRNPHARRKAVAVRIARPEQFGRPRPTKEELLMIRFAAKEPEMMASLIASTPDLDAPIEITPIPDDPIVIPPIEIKPIAIEPIQISSLI